MAVDLSKWPLLVLMEHVNRWKKSAQSDAFWETSVEHVWWTQRLRDEAKGIIVWLELRGLEEQASRLDERMSDFREAIWEFEHACEGTYPPEDWACQEQREEMIDKAGWVVGTAEDLNDEVDERVWEGYDDE